MSNPKILVAILATEEPPWIDIETYGQNTTWKMNPPAGIQIIRYTSAQEKNLLYFVSEVLWKITRLEKIFGIQFLGFVRKFWNDRLNGLKPDIQQDGPTVCINLPEAYSLIGLKTINFFEYVLKNYNFEYLYRTNVSSYVDLETLSKFVTELGGESSIYGGVKGTEGNTTFASGSGYLIDRKNLEKVASKKSKWDNFEIDDVALGKIAQNELLLPVTNFKRTDLPSMSHFTNIRVGMPGVFHYRCKARNSEDTIAIMKQIKKLLTNAI